MLDLAEIYLLEHETIGMCPDAEENNIPQWKAD